MAATTDQVTLTFPKAAVNGVSEISADLLDRMHALLERNTDGSLSAIEKAELETLVRMTQFSELLSSALQTQKQP